MRYILWPDSMAYNIGCAELGKARIVISGMRTGAQLLIFPRQKCCGIVNNFSPKIVDSAPQTAGLSLKTGASGNSLICNSIRSCGVLELGGQMAESNSGKCDIGVAGLYGLGACIARNISSHLLQVAAWGSRPGGDAAIAESLAPGELFRAKALPELAGLLRGPK